MTRSLRFLMFILCAPFGVLAAVSTTLADADALYRQKKWIPAAKAYDPIAKQALFCRLMLAIWTKQWDEAGALRDEFMRRYPASDKLKMVKGECGQLIARRIAVLEGNISQ